MQISLLLALFFIVLVNVSAFLAPRMTNRPALSSSNSLLNAKGKKASAVVNEKEYWEGDWVCADCGYVYDIDFDGGGLYFEQQKKGFICPQCSAPRRRYAKKVGDEWGVTNDGGDLPIYAFTFLGLALTTWFALVYVPTL